MPVEAGLSASVRRCLTLTACGAIVLCIAIFIGQRLPLGWPRHVGFLSVVGMIFFGNLLWWCWLDEWLAARARLGVRAGLWQSLRVAWAVYVVVMLVPVFLLMFRRRWWDEWPTLLIAWVMAWSLLLAAMSALAAVALVLAWPLRRLRKPKPAKGSDYSPSGGDPPGETSLSRRRLLLGATALPFVGAAATVISSRVQEGRFLVRRVTLQLPRLPDRLRGLTITHVSDMHTGRLFRPEHLPHMIDEVNALGSDIIAITGDIIDHSNDFLPAAGEAIASLEARHGRYVVLGNHDLIDDSRVFVRYMQEREPNFLIDRHVPIEIGGERLQIAGLGWSLSDHQRRGDPGHRRRAAAALAGSDPDVFTIALVHHPHAFDALEPLGVDLTLAGHTHGGQLMLTPPGWPLRIGAGSLAFRYLWGEYRRGHSALFVNAGVGNWFPVRVNAPAEIVQIRLV